MITVKPFRLTLLFRMNMILTLLFLLGSSPAFAGSECVNSLFTSNRGREISVSAEGISSEIPKGSIAFLLGSGRNISPSWVYRIEFADGTNQTLKYYEESKQASADYKALTYLYNLSLKPGYLGFEVAKPISHKGKIVWLEYIEGQTIMKLQKLASEKSNDSANTSYRNFVASKVVEYRRLYQQTSDALFASSSSVCWDSECHMIEVKDRTLVHVFLLHRDNVLVRSDNHHLVVFDPY